MAQFYMFLFIKQFMKLVDAIVETPKGYAEKFTYDKDSGFFKLKKILPSGMSLPYDFGFIPGTRGEDGDPLDIIVISEFKSFPGCMIECRLIGCIHSTQTEINKKVKVIRNDRFIGIPVPSVSFKYIHSIDEIPKKLMNGLKAFFINYNKAEGKKFKIIAQAGPRESYKMIQSGMNKNGKKEDSEKTKPAKK
jgi:inorganic pyrophosphatase